jgi:hypothetical protein
MVSFEAVSAWYSFGNIRRSTVKEKREGENEERKITDTYSEEWMKKEEKVKT